MDLISLLSFLNHTIYMTMQVSLFIFFFQCIGYTQQYYSRYFQASTLKKSHSTKEQLLACSWGFFHVCSCIQTLRLVNSFSCSVWRYIAFLFNFILSIYFWLLTFLLHSKSYLVCYNHLYMFYVIAPKVFITLYCLNSLIPQKLLKGSWIKWDS